ncbi:MAG: winged helix-turn-helix domain-containing protein [Candidatus Levyibacteriota bacterium]
MLDKPEATHFESLYPPQTRKREVTELISYIKKGSSAQAVALPGVGKSNFLRLLAYNNALRLKHLGENYKWFHFVYMDLSEVQERSLLDVLKFIMICLSYSLSERKLDEEQEQVNAFLKEALEFQDELILSQALKKAIDYLSIEKELTVIFLFDRFDTYLPHINPQFFLTLKILRNRAKYRFSCVFSVTRPLEDSLESSIYAEFYEFMAGNNIYLSLSDSYANDFRLSYLEKASGEKLPDAKKKEILKITGGHGKLLRIVSEIILSEKEPPKDETESLLSKAAVKTGLFEIWDALLPAEQKILFEKKTAEGYLADTGLLRDGKIMIPLFEANLRNFPQPSAEKISYNPETNEIWQGKENLTDKLSSSEFKLLRYLIQNKEKVCEKEEIISAVWTDSQTQEGVTDQALDQIIYRVRKKIEEDPNNPVHITTVKGRGYKFSE